MPIRSIIFDFDYTLADSSNGVYECVNYALKKMNFPERSYPDICKTIGLSLTKTYSFLTGHDNPSETEIFAKFFIEKADLVMAEKTSLFTNVSQTIKKIKTRGISLGIVSTKFRYRITAILKRENLLPQFDIIIGGEDVKKHKPDPEGLVMALSALSTSPSDCLYVGDSLVDAELAKRSHISFIAVCSGTTKANEFINYNPLYICDSVTELPALICQFNG